MIYTIWNKTSDIDGRTPEYIIGNNPAYGVEKTYILRENDETLVDILTISMIRAGDETGTDDEAVQRWIAAREAPPENPLAALAAENAQLRAKVSALTESAQMLEDCLVEMAEIVYA